MATLPEENSWVGSVSDICWTVGDEPALIRSTQNFRPSIVSGSPKPDFLPSAEMTEPPAWKMVL
jgi:hypothetical protein